AIEERAAQRCSALGAKCVPESAKTLGITDNCIFALGDLSVAPSNLAQFMESFVGRRVALGDPAVVADEARKDQVHVAVGGVLGVVDDERTVECGAVTREHQFGSEV